MITPKKIDFYTAKLCFYICTASILGNFALAATVCKLNMKKALREMQTLHAGCSNTDPKIFAPPQTPFPGVRDGQNLISWDMVTTFTYRPSLVKIDARNLELSW